VATVCPLGSELRAAFRSAPGRTRTCDPLLRRAAFVSDRGSPGEYELMYPSGASPWTSNGAWVDSYAAVHRGDRVLLLRDQHPLPKRLAEDLAPGAGTWKSSGLSGGTGSGLDGPYIGEEAEMAPAPRDRVQRRRARPPGQRLGDGLDDKGLRQALWRARRVV